MAMIDCVTVVDRVVPQNGKFIAIVMVINGRVTRNGPFENGNPKLRNWIISLELQS